MPKGQSLEKRNQYVLRLESWVNRKYLQLALFNIFLIVLVLLKSAGYFEPFFPITINLIFFTSLVLSVFLLGTTHKAAVWLALLFWALAGLFRIIHIDVWAERAALYSFEAFATAIILLVVRRVRLFKKND